MMKFNVKNLLKSSLVILLAASATANAATVTWDGDAGDNDWFNPVNWSDDTLPSAIDDIVIPAGTPMAAADGRIFVATGTITINAVDTYINELLLAASATGELTVESGAALAADSLWMGFHRNSSAVANISGTVDIHSAIIGASGSGNLTLGGTADTSVIDQLSAGLSKGSAGEITLAANSETVVTDLMLIGGRSAASLDILATAISSDKAELYTGTAILAQDPDSSATVDIYGMWSLDGALVAGVGGHADISIYRGGQLYANQLLAGTNSLGNHGSAEINVNGDDTTLDITGDAFIGEAGPAMLNVENSGSFSAADMYLGINTNDEAHVQLVDGDVTTVVSNVRGNGQMNITDGEVSLDSLYIGCLGDGEVVVNGGQLNVAQRIYIPRDISGTGRLTVESGDVAADRIFVGGGYLEGENDFVQEGYLTGEVTVESALTLGRWGHFDGSAVFNGARFDNESPFGANSDIHSLTFNDINNYLEAASKPNGIGRSAIKRGFAIDTLTISENAQLQLCDDFDNNPSANGGDFVYINELVLESGSLIQLNGVTVVYNTLIDNGGTIELAGGQLLASQENAGDINGDGETDLDDFIILKQNYGTEASFDSGDLNLDGKVDLDDFIILKQNYGK